MKNRDEVIVLFRAKYDYLKSVYPEVGSFDEAVSSNFYQNPDGGWQLNLSPCAAITLRPGDDEAHETHGAICARWYEEGAAFDKNGDPEWLGYPTKDEMPREQGVFPPCPAFLRQWNPSPIFVSGAISEFECGTIMWHEGLSWDRANENHDYDHVQGALAFQAADDAWARGDEESMDEHLARMSQVDEARKSGHIPDPRDLCGPMSRCDLAVNPGTMLELNDRGKNSMPHDIELAIVHILAKRGFHSQHSETECALIFHGECKGPTWTFRTTSENGATLTVQLWHDSANSISGQLEETPPTPQNVWTKLFQWRETFHDNIYIPKGSLSPFKK